MFDKIVHFIRELYKTDGPIYLLEPAFLGDERKYLADCIDTGFVSTAGPYVEKLENANDKYTGAKFAISIVTRFGEFVGDDAPWFIHIALRAQRRDHAHEI